MAALQFTEIATCGTTIFTFDMLDRRPEAGSSQPTRWMFQTHLEAILYGKTICGSTGAVYRLLQRTPGAKGRAMCLHHRSTAVSRGLCTVEEWDAMVDCMHSGVRTFTLVPVETAAAAIAVFGETKESSALLEALGFDRPASWDEGEEEGEAEGEEEENEGEEEDEGGEEGEDDEDDEDDEEGECSGDQSDGAASVAATEEFADEEAEEEDDDDELPAGGEEGGSDSVGDDGKKQHRAKKAARTCYTLVDVPEALQRDLDAFGEWRLAPMNQTRDGGKVEPVTIVGNKADALRLLGWLKAERNITPSLSGVFGSDRLGSAVEAFVLHLVRCGRTYGTICGYLRSFLAIAKFVHAVRVSRAAPGTSVSTIAVDAMKRAHLQAQQEARTEQKFSAKPVNWLDWAGVQAARARAVRQYEHIEKGESEGDVRAALFDATLLTWLTSVPPDRVGVTRLLQLGVTLKSTETGFNLDLSSPTAHKTAAAFGPVVTAVPEPAAKLLKAWLAAMNRTVAAKSHVFVKGDDASAPLGSPQWTKLVKNTFKRHSAVALAPKELRSSFITWLRSDENSDEVLKAAAFAMRHSTKQAAGPSYDKERAERLSSKAVAVAGAFASGFE